VAPAAARTVTVCGGNSAQNDTYSLMSGNPSAGTQTVSILAGVPSGGTQILNLLSQTGQAGTVNIGSGAAMANNINIGGTGANVLALANTQTAGSVSVGGAMTTGTISLGAATMTGTITVGASTAAGGQTINIGSAANGGAQVIAIGNGASGANSEVDILSGVGTAGAGTLKMANNARVTTVDLANIAPAAARTLTICGGNSAQNDTINILGGNPSANTQTFSVLNGTPTGGTQAVNIVGDNNTNAATIKIGTGAAAHLLTLGSKTGAAALTLQGGSGSIKLDTGTNGAIQMVPATSSTAAATSSVTMNNRVGCATFTGFTTAAGASQSFTITNSTVLTTSCVHVTVANLNASTNNAQMSILGVTQAAGSIIVNTKNNGSGALGAGDNVLINFWILS